MCCHQQQHRLCLSGHFSWLKTLCSNPRKPRVRDPQDCCFQWEIISRFSTPRPAALQRRSFGGLLKEMIVI